jgi:hypothetical protein
VKEANVMLVFDFQCFTRIENTKNSLSWQHRGLAKGIVLRSHNIIESVSKILKISRQEDGKSILEFSDSH